MIQIGRITGTTVETNRDSDDPGRMLQVELTDPTDVQACELFAQAGDDNNPPNDAMCIVLTVSDALKIVVAVTDDLEPECAQGEREIYSQADGKKKARVKLTKDGIVIHNEGGRQVARNGDEVKSDITVDQAFWTWVSAVSTALGITPPPTTLTAKIADGTDEVLVP